MVTLQTSLLIALSAVAAFAGLVVGGAMLAAPRRRDAGVGVGVAALAAIAGAVALQVGWQHAGTLPDVRPVAFIEGVLTALSGAVLLDVVWRCLKGRAAPRVIYAPTALYAAAALIAPARLAGYLEPPYILPLQWGFTLAAAVLWTLERRTASLARARLALGLIAALGAIHAVQIVRSLGGGAAWSRDIVPVAIALILAGAVVLVLHPAGRRLFADARKAVGRSPEAAALFARFEAWLESIGAFLDPQLRLTDAAAALNVRPEALSAAVNEAAGATFPAYIARRRVTEARRLLEDPAEVRTSIEAIGLLSGFRSRSAFYEAFRAQLGVTPAQYRSARAGQPRPET